MRYFNNGAFYTVTCSRSDVEEFARKWPCFGSTAPISFQFERKSGDLVDMRGGSASDDTGVLALSHDAQAYALKREA